MDFLDPLEQGQEIRKTSGEQVFERAFGVHYETEDLGQNIPLGKPDLLWIDSGFSDHRVDQILLIFAVHNGEAAVVTKSAAMAAKHPVANRMKGAAPDAA